MSKDFIKLELPNNNYVILNRVHIISLTVNKDEYFLRTTLDRSQPLKVMSNDLQRLENWLILNDCD